MNFVILGPQGSGKGTQAALLVERFQLKHLDIGQLLREVAKEDTPLGKEVQRVINDRKELVSNSIIEKVLRAALEKIPRQTGVVIDGAPRRVDQIPIIEKILADMQRTLDAVISITVPQSVSIDRISHRFRCDRCRKRYIRGSDLSEGEKQCSACGGKIMQREDDTPSGVKKRLAIFAKETMPVIEAYRIRGKIITVDGNMEVEKTFADILAGISQKG
ncbi:MAG TPA: nucleoside monophosphate kinase [Patescibacteria group bacterium]|nr:nucleoside monophosphate kinase [Patescibacteria group bacterium]